MCRALCLRTCTTIRADSCMCKYEHVVCMSVRVPAPLKCLGVAEKPDCVEDGVFIDCFMSSWVIYMRYSGCTTGWKKLVWEQSHPKSLFRSACLHLDDASSARSRWSSVSGLAGFRVQFEHMSRHTSPMHPMCLAARNAAIFCWTGCVYEASGHHSSLPKIWKARQQPQAESLAV